MNKNRYTIDSVLGFNLKADIKDQQGRIISTRVRSIYPPVISKQISYKLINRSFFTTFNEALLNKIRDYKRVNE